MFESFRYKVAISLGSRSHGSSVAAISRHFPLFDDILLNPSTCADITKHSKISFLLSILLVYVKTRYMGLYYELGSGYLGINAAELTET